MRVTLEYGYNNTNHFFCLMLHRNEIKNQRYSQNKQYFDSSNRIQDKYGYFHIDKFDIGACAAIIQNIFVLNHFNNQSFVHPRNHELYQNIFKNSKTYIQKETKGDNYYIIYKKLSKKLIHIFLKLTQIHMKLGKLHRLFAFKNFIERN